jgi:hypothetical protein
MQRRQFLTYLAGAPVIGFATVRVLGAVPALGATGLDLGVRDAASCQSFGYYEPLGVSDPHDPSQTDGTTYNMPCISAQDIAAAVDKQYTFWHGHDGVNHMFTVTADDFKALQQGQELLLYTTMVEDHRHPLQITPSTACASAR